MALTDYAKDLILDECTHVGLFSAAPSDAGGGTELSGAGYARQAVSWTRAGDTAVNDADLRFESTGGDWETVGWVGLFDASTGGNLVQWKAITAFTNLAGRAHTFVAGDIEVDFE